MAIVRVKRKNKIVKIDERSLVGYLKSGYDQIDENGKVLKKATGGSVISIGVLNKKIDECEKLEAENKKLKAEIAALKKEK